MRKVRVPLAILTVIAISIAVGFALPAASTRTQPVYAGAGASDKYDGDCTGNETVGRCADKPAFDHSLCQYPERTTNPPDGCDNTDPCDPANVKGGSGDCAPVTTTPTTPVTTNPNQCGGK